MSLYRLSIALNHLWGCADGVQSSTTGEWAPIVDHYVRSIYWAMTALTTAGYGDVSATTRAEEIFSIFVLVIGTLIFATVIANLEEIVAQVDVTSTLFQQSVDEVKAFMKMRYISDSAQEDIGKYHDTLWLKQKGASETAVLGYLPSRVRHEVLKHHAFKALKGAPIFSDCELSFLNSVLDILEGEFFLQDHEVWEKGECGFDMYMVARGNIDLYDGKNKLFSVGSGGLLGESEFFKQEPRSTTAVASEYTTTFFLAWDKLQEILDKDEKHAKIFSDGLLLSESKFDTSKQVEKMRKNLKAGGKMATMMMLDDNTTEVKELVFLPDSVMRRSWDIVVMFVMIANFLIIPVRVAYFEDDPEKEGLPEAFWFSLNFFLDFFLWFDIFFQFKYFAVVFEGLLISDRHEFSELYKYGSLKWDVLASVPLDAVVWLCGVTNIRTVTLFRLLRIILFFRFPYNIQSTIDFCEEHGIRAKAGIWHCSRMLVFVLLVTHWSACTFYYIAVSQGLASESSWTAQTPLNETDIRMSEKYSTSLYWSMYTITLVGYGDITLQSNGEMVFSMITMLVGTILCDAGITAILSSLIHQMDASAGHAQAWAQVITKYMRHRSLPLELQERIFGFFVHMHLSEDDLDEFKVLMCQPRFIKNKLLEEICMPTIRSEFTPLSQFSDGLIKSVVRGMYPYLALPKELLVAINQPCDKMYVIVRGKVNVLTASRNKYLVTDCLEQGRVVGDFTEPEETYRTVSYCELYCLKLEHYSKCFSYVKNNTDAALLSNARKSKKLAMSSSRNRTSSFNGSFGATVNLSALTSMKSKLMRRTSILPILAENDPKRKAWDIACLFLAIYLAIIVPFQAFILPDYAYFEGSNVGLNVLDIFVDIFFLVDIIFRCTSFDDFDARHGDVDDTIFWMYIDQSLFWADIISSIPLEHLAASNPVHGIAIFRLIKLVRVFRIPNYLTALQDLMEERRILTHIGLQRMWNLFFLSALSGHWAASVFFYTSREDSDRVADELAAGEYSRSNTTWIAYDGLISYSVKVDPMTSANVGEVVMEKR